MPFPATLGLGLKTSRGIVVCLTRNVLKAFIKSHQNLPIPATSQDFFNVHFLMDLKIKLKLFKRFEPTKYATSNKIGRSFQIVVTSLEYMNFKETTFYNSKSMNQKIIILIHRGSRLNVLDEEGRSLSKAIKTIH